MTKVVITNSSMVFKGKMNDVVREINNLMTIHGKDAKISDCINSLKTKVA